MHYGIHDLVYGGVATIPLKVFQRRQPRPDLQIIWWQIHCGSLKRFSTDWTVLGMVTRKSDRLGPCDFWRVCCQCHFPVSVYYFQLHMNDLGVRPKLHEFDVPFPPLCGTRQSIQFLFTRANLTTYRAWLVPGLHLVLPQCKTPADESQSDNPRGILLGIQR